LNKISAKFKKNQECLKYRYALKSLVIKKKLVKSSIFILSSEQMFKTKQVLNVVNFAAKDSDPLTFGCQESRYLPPKKSISLVNYPFEM
jgi:hypothetical protein